MRCILDILLGYSFALQLIQRQCQIRNFSQASTLGWIRPAMLTTLLPIAKSRHSISRRAMKVMRPSSAPKLLPIKRQLINFFYNRQNETHWQQSFDSLKKGSVVQELPQVLFQGSPVHFTHQSREIDTQTLQEPVSGVTSQQDISQTQVKVWGKPSNGLQAFKMIKLILPQRNKSLSTELEQLNQTTLKPIIQRGYSRRGKVTVANYLGDQIGNNIDQNLLTPANNRQLIKRAYNEMKDQLKLQTQGVVQSKTTTAMKTQEVSAEICTSIQSDRKIKENKRAIQLLKDELQIKNLSRRLAKQSDLLDPINSSSFNTARTTINSHNQISFQERQTTGRNGISGQSTPRASECPPFTLKDHLGGNISAFLTQFEEQQRRKTASTFFAPSSVPSNAYKPEDSLYSVVNIESGTITTRIGSNADKSEVFTNPKHSVNHNQIIGRPDQHTTTIQSSKLVHSNVLDRSRNRMVEILINQEGPVEEIPINVQSPKQPWWRPINKTIEQRVAENQGKHRHYTQFNSPERTKGKLPVIPPASQQGDRKFIVPRKLKKHNSPTIDDFERDPEDTAKALQAGSPNVSELNSPFTFQRTFKLNDDLRLRKEKTNSFRLNNSFNLSLKRHNTRMPKSKHSRITVTNHSVNSESEQKHDDLPPILEMELVNELVKCYLEKRKMVLDGHLSAFNADEVASTRSGKSSRQGGLKPQTIDIQTLSMILAKDLAARKIREEFEVAKLQRALYRQQQRLKQITGTNEMDARYQALFEDFMLELIAERTSKLSKEHLVSVYDGMTDHQKAFFKLVTRKDALQPKLVELATPEQEQVLLKKPEGRLIATKAGFNLLKSLIDSYQKDELKIENKLTRRLRTAFLSALQVGVGKQRLNEVVSPTQQNLESKVVEWESEETSDSELTDESFVDDQQSDPNKKVHSRRDSFASSSSSQNEQPHHSHQFTSQAKQETIAKKLASKYQRLAEKAVKKQVHLVDIENNPEQLFVKVLREQGDTQEFYLDLKSILGSGYGLKAALTEKDPNPSLHFVERCIKNQITPVPAFAKIVGRTFSLQDFWISDSLADALQAYFANYQDEIRTVQLARNGLKDCSLSKILRGLRGQKIEKISLVGNEIGLETLTALTDFFNCNLKALELGEIKFVDKVQERYGINLVPMSRLRSLTLSGIDIHFPATYAHFKTFIETGNVFLRELNLTWAYLNEKQLVEILNLIHDCKPTLSSLNLSFNANQSSSRQKSTNKFQRQLAGILASYIKRNNYLNHLNISGMQLGDSVIDVIPAIQASSMLNAVHLSDNDISTETKQLIFNLLGLDMKQAKEKRDQKAPNINHHDNFKSQTSAQARIVNHQLWQDARHEARVVNQKQTTQRDPFVLYRFTGHPEFLTEIQVDDRLHTQGLKWGESGQRWRISLKEECWVCDRWSYVMVFFHRTKCTKQMENVDENSELYAQLQEHCFRGQKEELMSKNTQQSVMSLHKDGQNPQAPPIITGSVCAWQVHEMTELRKLLDQFSKMREMMETAAENGSLTEIYKKNFVTRRHYERTKDCRRDQMETGLQLKLLGEIRSQIPCGSDAVVINWPDEKTLAQTKPGDYYVWTGYAKPGNHSCVVIRSYQDSKNIATYQSSTHMSIEERPCQMYRRNFIVSVRKDEAEIPQSVDQTDHQKVEAVQELLEVKQQSTQNLWRQGDFVFQNWRKDDEDEMMQAMVCDQKYWNMRELCRGCRANEDTRVLELIQMHYAILQEVFIERACRSGSYPRLDLLSLQQMCKEWELLGIDAPTVEKMFQVLTKPAEQAQHSIPYAGGAESSNKRASILFSVVENQQEIQTSPMLGFGKASTNFNRQQPHTSVNRARHHVHGFSHSIQRFQPSDQNMIPDQQEDEETIFVKERLDLKLGTKVSQSADAISRFQFFNFLGLLAHTFSFDANCLESQKQLRRAQTTHQEDKGVNKRELRIADALRDVIEHHILRRNLFKMRVSLFRTSQLWTAEVNEQLAPRNEALARLFHGLLESVRSKKVFSINSARKLSDRLQKQVLSDDALLVGLNGQPVYAQSCSDHPLGGYWYNLVIAESEVNYCFGMSKMTVIDEITQAKQYHELKFIEFLEFLARLASLAKLQLTQKSQVKKQKTENEALDETQQQHTLGYMQVIRRRLVPGLSQVSQLADDISSLMCFMQPLL